MNQPRKGKEVKTTPYTPAWSSLGESDKRARGASPGEGSREGPGTPLGCGKCLWTVAGLSGSSDRTDSGDSSSSEVGRPKGEYKSTEGRGL